MRMKGISGLLSISVVAVTVILSGCLSQKQYDDMKSQNRIQQQRITSLESELDTAKVQADQLSKQNETLQSQSSTNIGAKSEEILALENDIAKKKELISKMRDQLLRSGVKLPIELSVMLQEFAKNNEMVTFDADTGVLKFKSDLLFEPGSDLIGADAVGSLREFCRIMNANEAKNFDIVIVGHTDDVPIKKAETKAQHPTNWHLSVHRAISVLNVITKSQISSERVSVKGFGEFKPVEPNKPNKKGNPANRRVEIFVVPSGT
jgi:chemotaxis protein MotB